MKINPHLTHIGEIKDQNYRAIEQQKTASIIGT